MNIVNPKTLKIIKGLPPVAKKGDRIAIDSEFRGQIKAKLHRPHGTFAYLGASYDGQTVYWIDDETQIQEFYNLIDLGVHIYHHAKYDVTQLRRFACIPDRRNLWDTMLIEQIQYSGYYTDFGLSDLVRRYLDTYMPKEVRTEFADDTVLEMTREQIEYASADVAYTWKVAQCQKEKISENDLQIWREIELPFLWTLLSVRGMNVDVNAWTTLYQENYADAIEVQKRYMENPEILGEMELTDATKKKKLVGISLGSNVQVAKEISRLGYKLPKTKTGRDSTQEDGIAPFAHECEFVRDVLEFRGKLKASSTYGKSWIENDLIEKDGCVYSSFNQMGAATGRLSSSNPNVENIPVRETPEFRKCFVAKPGHILVDADWSAQEPRIFAYQSQDEKLIQIFKDGKDVYIEAARLMFGWELDKKDPRRKERMKPTVLGASYGLTEYGMEKKYDIPRDEGKELLDTFFDTFEGAAEYKKTQTRIKDFVTTIYGRKFWLDVYQKGYENNALNSPTQGSAGDAMKLAGVEFRKRTLDAGCEEKVYIINYIHDEILVECEKELLDWTEKNLRKVMIEVAETMHEGIPADVEIHHGYSWHDAH